MDRYESKVVIGLALLLGAAGCDRSDEGGSDGAAMDTDADGSASGPDSGSGEPGTSGDGGSDGAASDGDDSAGSDGDTDGGDPSDTGSDTGRPQTFCDDGEIWPAYFEQQPVPPATDTYVCHGFTLQTDSLQHAIAFAPSIDNGSYVHHMILYKVQAPVGDDSDCFHGPDWVFQYGWAPGVQDFYLPEEAGFLVGNGAGGQTHYVLEIHYYNPAGNEGEIDNSGVDMCLTDQLRPNNASVLAFGDVPGISIPPGEPAYEHTSECPGAVTAVALTEPLTVFGSMLHAHKIGRQIYTEQFRGGEKIGELGREDNFDFNLQKIDAIEGTIMPGDRLTTTCVYDSTERTGVTNGGEGSDDEMCLNFLAYYPEIPYPACTIPG